MKKAVFFFIACILSFASYAQIKHKVMLIPFESKLYMSQIDHKINAETKLSQKEIKEAFRKGINAELVKALKQKYEVLDLLKDTAKYKKDILAIYKSITFSYEKVPSQSNYKAPVEEKGKNATIQNGQILVESNADARFMNAKVTNPALIPGLYAKHKTDLFLFINQLDIISNQLAAGDMGAAGERIITLHYTVFTADVNTPAKIVSGYVSKLGTEIARRIALALTKIEAAPKK